jgi:glycosyltransferase involved in cell wall biosynthesis
MRGRSRGGFEYSMTSDAEFQNISSGIIPAMEDARDKMDGAPLVSVVTPSYNQGRFIRATIESVLSQDYPNIEYIVMDGGSTDETASIVQEYGSRVVFISKRDRGQSHAINKGFRLAKGSVLAWLNSDDVFLPGAVGTAVQALNCNPDAGLVYGDGYLIDAAGNVTERFPHTREPDLWRLVHLSDYILQQSVFFRREVLDDVGYVDESLFFGMDWDLLIRIALKYRLAYVPAYLGCLREYPETKSSSGGVKRVRELHAMLRKHTALALPPGSTVYGLDTYADLACRAIRRRTPSLLNPLGRVLELAVRFTAGNVVNRTLLHSQGLYLDGWAGKTLLYMLRSGCKSVLIQGSVPERARQLRGQSLYVECNGRCLGRHAVGMGPFSIEINLPPDLTNQALRFRIVARRSFVPSPIPWKGDRRRLAYKLSSVCGL